MNLSRTRYLVLLALAAGALLLSCDNGGEDKKINPTPPNTPNLLAILNIDLTSIRMNWHDNADDEDGFRIERSEDELTWVTDGTVGIDVNEYTSTGLAQGTEYFYRVWAFNAAGDSPNPSGTASATTRTGDLAPRPGNVAAEAQSAAVVYVSWVDPGVVDSFVIRRRTPETEWGNIAAVDDGVEEYLDTSVSAETVYYYLVGSANVNGINWALDSAAVTTPLPGAPQPPSNLIADIELGVGVTLSWVDHSADEVGFEIARQPRAGQLFAVIDTVLADITTYLDPLGDETGRFGYKVRAYNELGSSAWTDDIVADYRFCSDGVIPICHGNWWEYRVTDIENETEYMIRRSIPPVNAFIQEDIHYLMIEQNLLTSEVDSLWYLRNYDDYGCSGAFWPLGANPTSDPLFKDPPGSVGSSYRFHGDSIVVVSHSVSVELPDESTIDGCIVYQRFVPGSERSYRYFVKPYSIGIVKEDEIITSDPVIERYITEWHLNNVP